jgi:hypothetical protein
MTDLESAIGSTTANTSPGDDSVNFALIRASPPALLLWLLATINTSWLHGTFPRVWQESTTVGLPKCAAPSKPADYRPVSLLPCLGKVMENGPETPAISL